MGIKKINKCKYFYLQSHYQTRWSKEITSLGNPSHPQRRITITEISLTSQVRPLLWDEPTARKLKNKTVYYKEMVACRHLIFSPEVIYGSTVILPNRIRGFLPIIDNFKRPCPLIITCKVIGWNVWLYRKMIMNVTNLWAMQNVRHSPICHADYDIRTLLQQLIQRSCP